jgi:uncharacterized RDD family membrane protein YckC
LYGAQFILLQQYKTGVARSVFILKHNCMSSVQIATPFNLHLDFEIAELHKRIFAYCIDLFIVSVYAWIMGNFVYSDGFAGGQGFGRSNAGWGILLISLPILLYPLICELAMHGQTLGKKVFDLRVMNLQGGEPTLSQYTIRWMFRFFEWPLVFGVALPGFYILLRIFSMVLPGIVVIVTIAITRRNQRLGDLAANTVLVSTRINTSINDTVFQEIDQTNYELLFPQVMRLSDRDINTIKSVVSNSHAKSRAELAYRTAERVKSALKIETAMDPLSFLDKLLQDYNYVATKE